MSNLWWEPRVPCAPPIVTQIMSKQITINNIGLITITKIIGDTPLRPCVLCGWFVQYQPLEQVRPCILSTHSFNIHTEPSNHYCWHVMRKGINYCIIIWLRWQRWLRLGMQTLYSKLSMADWNHYNIYIFRGDIKRKHFIAVFFK